MTTQNERAIELAKQGFMTELLRDETTDGDYIYLARNPELEGCMAQGLTPEEALANLEAVRIEHIEHLIEFNLPIPQPTRSLTTIKEKVGIKNISRIAFVGYEGYFSPDVQSSEREVLFSITQSPPS